MPFFDLTPKTSTPVDGKFLPVVNRLVDALDQATMRWDRTMPNLCAIRVDMDNMTLASCDKHLLVKIQVSRADMDRIVPLLTSLGGGKEPEHTGTHYWVSPSTAREMRLSSGWIQDPSFVYPPLESVIPRKFAHGYGDTSTCRPFLSFDITSRIHNVYESLEIQDPGFIHFKSNNLRDAVVDERETRIQEDGFHVDLSLFLLAMPITNPNITG